MAEHISETHHDDNHQHAEGEHHIVSIPKYLLVFAGLIVGTIATYFTAQYDLDWIFPGANTLLALLIAFAKMTIVVLWFMHVKYSSKLIWLTALAGFFWLAIMFAFTMQDYLTRSSGVFVR